MVVKRQDTVKSIKLNHKYIYQTVAENRESNGLQVGEFDFRKRCDKVSTKLKRDPKFCKYSSYWW